MDRFTDFTAEAVAALAKLDIDANFFSAEVNAYGRFDAYPVAADGTVFRIIIDVGMEDLKVEDPIILRRTGDLDCDVGPSEVPADILHHATAFQQVMTTVADAALAEEVCGANRYRLFHLKIVPDDRPNADGRWIERVVPAEWPGDDHAEPHMLREQPSFDTVPCPGFHIVEIREAVPGPSDQPGTMREAAMLPPSDFDEPEAPGMRF